MLDFASRLKLVRVILLGQSRDEFSDLVDIPKITLSAWETRKASPAAASLLKLIHKLDKSPFNIDHEWLEHGKGVPSFLIKSELKVQFTVDLDLEKKIKIDNFLLPLLKRGDFVNCRTINYEDVKHLDVVVVETANANYIVYAITSDAAELFLLPMNADGMGEIIRYNRREMKLYKITSCYLS